MVRVAGDRALAGEKLAVINFLGGADYPSVQIDSIYHHILNFDEHSGGGAGWPGMLTKKEINRSNRIDFKTALKSYRSSDSLLTKGLERLGEMMDFSSPAILVFNPLSWKRTDIVRIQLPDKVYNQTFIIRDGVTMEEIPYEKTANSSVAFVATGVPPTGYKIYYGEIVTDPPEYSDRVVFSQSTSSLENNYYTISVDSQGLSILDKKSGRELVNMNSEFFFNGLIRAQHLEDFYGLYHQVPIGTISLNGTSGAVSGEMIAEFDTSPMVSARIILFSDIKRIEIINTLDKERMRFVPYDNHSDHYSFTFPFDLDVSSGFQVRIENPGILIRPDLDYLPGALIGNFASQHAIDMREASGYGITLANRESFINEIGGVSHRNSTFEPQEATIVSKAFQKIDQGETKDQGIVTITSMDHGIEVWQYHFAITSSFIPPDSLAVYAPVITVRIGWSFDVPLEAVFVPGVPGVTYSRNTPEECFFQLSKNNVILVAVKKARFGGSSDIIFRVQEISGISTANVHLHSFFGFTHAEINSTVEDTVSAEILPVDPITFDIGPREILTIRAR
jgi:hypothetical protein